MLKWFVDAYYKHSFFTQQKNKQNKINFENFIIIWKKKFKRDPNILSMSGLWHWDLHENFWNTVK